MVGFVTACIRVTNKLPTENAQYVKSFLKEHVYHLNVCNCGGSIVGLPEYDIHPRGFLEYAEVELEDLGLKRSIINCVSNLKRAIDAQIDVFLFSLNLLEFYKSKRLGVDRKLGFIEKCGMFSRHALSRINAIRNKLEHEYKLPEADDILIYFDVVSAFISVLEVQLLIGGGDGELEFILVAYPEDPEAAEVAVGRVTSEYDPKSCSHTISWSKNEIKEAYTATAKNLDELAAFIRYHILLLNIHRTYHGEYANSQLSRL